MFCYLLVDIICNGKAISMSYVGEIREMMMGTVKVMGAVKVV